MAKVKLTSSLCLASLAFLSPLSASRMVNALRPNIEDQIQRPELAQSIERALFETMADDSKIVLLQAQDLGPRFLIHLKLKQDARFPDRQAIHCTFTSPGGQDRHLTITFPKQLRGRDQSWLAKQISELIATQLKAESLVELGDRLDADMHVNVVHLNPERRHLAVELIGKRHLGSKADLIQEWENQSRHIAEKEQPITPKRAPEAQNEVLAFHRAPNTEAIDPDNPPVHEPPYERTPLHPFKAQMEKELQRQPSFRFPRFLVSGPAALTYTPSLGINETDPRDFFNVDVSTSFALQDYAGSSGPYTRYKWDGTLTRYHISASTRLWKKVGLILDGGFGGHDGDAKLDVAHNTAPGGTTFLPKGSLSTGVLDTSFTINYLMENKSGLFRPHFTIKFPTGDQQNLLGSGEMDFSAGASMEWSVQSWHIKGMLSYTKAGDLNVMDPGQAILRSSPYLYASFGLGRELNLWGHERVAMSLNYMENPLGRVSDLDDLDIDIVSFNALIEKRFSQHSDVRLEGSYGLTSSSPDASFTLGVKLHF
jgi:hypothetical protein